MAVGGAEAAAETAVVENKEWYIARYAPKGIPNSDQIKLRTLSFSLAENSIPNGNVAVQILYISIDPYLRTQLSGLYDGLSLPQLSLGQVYHFPPFFFLFSHPRRSTLVFGTN